jgi:hypothetical protein
MWFEIKHEFVFWLLLSFLLTRQGKWHGGTSSLAAIGGGGNLGQDRLDVLACEGGCVCVNRRQTKKFIGLNTAFIANLTGTKVKGSACPT